MGAETSVLQGCKLEDPLPTPSQKDWTIHPAQRKDGSRVSVFVHKKQEATETRTEYHLENAARQLKILRHPTILKFFASCENIDGTFLITEQVKPLDLVIENLTPEEICAGLYNVVEALSFLHERGGASHNNVCMSSIYVSCQDGGWRLGGMEHLCKFEDATVQFLKQSKPLRNAQCIPPEEKEDGSLTSTAPSYGHARDAYGFGVLAQNMLEYLSDLGEMTDSFEVSIEEFVDPDTTKRPKLSTLMADKLFKNDFLDITNFLKNLTLKSESQKNVFFEGLACRLHRLPRQLVASRLTPLLLNSFVMAEPMAVCHVFPHLLVPCRGLGKKRHQEFLADQVNPLIPLELFKRHVIPVLGKVFPSRELHVRNVLLQQFTHYADLFNVEKLTKVILPQLLLGLKDSNDEIVSASLRALADLVPILGAATVVGGERIRYFVEGRPKFPKQQESPLHLSGHVSSVTAVSGVITLPILDNQPSKPPLPPSMLTTKGLEVMGSEVMVKSPADNNGDVSLEMKKLERERQREERERIKEERERRREEMRLKNEERKRERERKKALQSGRLTLAALAKEHAEEQDSAISSQMRSPTTIAPTVSLSSPSEESYVTSQVTMSSQATSQATSQVSVSSQATSQATSHASWEDESDSDKPDWSDWEDMDNPTQSETRLGVGISSQDQSRTSSVSKETSDWSAAGDDWNDSHSDWSESSSQKTASSKKKTSALQLKSSLKKKPDNNYNSKSKSAVDLETKPTKTSKPSKTSAATKGQMRKPQELGKEYDIPDITAAVSPEPDFFADMEPSFSFKGSKVKSSMGSASETTRKDSDKKAETLGTEDKVGTIETEDSHLSGVPDDSTVSKMEPISFAMDDSTDGGNDGWGAGDDDDFNWDIEEDS